MSKIKFIKTTDKDKYEDKVSEGADGSLVFYKSSDADKSIYANGLRYDFNDTITESFTTTESVGGISAGTSIAAGDSVAELLKQLLYNDVYPIPTVTDGVYTASLNGTLNMSASVSGQTIVGDSNYFPLGATVTVSASMKPTESFTSSKTTITGLTYYYSTTLNDSGKVESTSISSTETPKTATEAYSLVLDGNEAKTCGSKGTLSDSKNYTKSSALDVTVSATATGYAKDCVYGAINPVYIRSKAGNYNLAQTTSAQAVTSTATAPTVSKSITIHFVAPIICNGVWSHINTGTSGYTQDGRGIITSSNCAEGSTTQNAKNEYCVNSDHLKVFAKFAGASAGEKVLYVPQGLKLDKVYQFNPAEGSCSTPVPDWNTTSSTSENIHGIPYKKYPFTSVAGAATYMFILKADN